MTQDTGSSSGIAIGRVLLALGLVAASLVGGYLLISAPSGEDPKLALDPPKDSTPEAAVPERELTPEADDQSATQTVDDPDVETATDQEPIKPDETTNAVAQDEGEAPNETEAMATTEKQVEPAEPELPSPSFDVVRVDSAGNAVVAGQAEAGQTVHIFLDEEEVHSTTVDSGGGFVGLFEIPPSQDGRALTIEVEDSDGARRSALATALVSPFGKPEDVTTSEEPKVQVEVAEPAAEPVEPETTVEATEPPEQPTILIVDEDGARQSQPSAAPSAPTATDRVNVVIDTISYDANGDVVLVGRALQGALLRLYLNNALWTSGEVPGTGVWQINLMDVDPGIYTLRVDELDDSGRVTSRFETPFQRESPEVAIAALNPEKPATPSRLPKPGAAPSPTPEAAPARHSAPKAVIVTVQPGFTLWGIADKRYGDGLLYVQVYEANSKQIKDPDLIYPGQVFSLPED